MLWFFLLSRSAFCWTRILIQNAKARTVHEITIIKSQTAENGSAISVTASGSS